MAKKKLCPDPGACVPPAPLIPVVDNPEYCSELVSDRCVQHTGEPIPGIGALSGTRLDVILRNISNLISAPVIWDSKEAALEGIAPENRLEGTLIPVRENDTVILYWFLEGTENNNFVPFIIDPDALLHAGAELVDVDAFLKLTGTRWRINNTIFSITEPLTYTIPDADPSGLLRIDNVIADANGVLIYQTGTPSGAATPPDVPYKHILVSTLYISTGGSSIDNPPVVDIPGTLLFGFENPPSQLGSEGDSYLDQGNGNFWSKEVSGWILKYSPPSAISGLTAGRVTLSASPTTVTDDAGLTYDRGTKQLKLNTTVNNGNYKFLSEGGYNLISGVLNMDAYDSVFNMSGGRTMIFANGFGMRFRLFNNDLTDHPDTSKSFSWYNKGFEHMRLWSDATSLNGQGQPTTWEFKARINYRLYLTHTAASTGAFKVLTRNDATGEVEYIDPIPSIDTSGFIQNQTASVQTAGFNVSTKSKIDNISISRGPGTNPVSNTAVGRDPLFNNTDGVLNTAFGSFPLYSNTIGGFNAAFGTTALTLNTTGSGNTGMGAWALYYNTVGYGNTAVGAAAGVGTGTGSWPANGRTTVDTDSTFIGNQSSRDVSVAQMTPLINATAIGAFSKVGSSNALILGGQGSYVPRVGIGTVNPHSTAILDLTSTTKGILPPRLNTSERDAIVAPAEGLAIYNTTTKTNEFFNGTIWTSPSGGGSASRFGIEDTTAVQNRTVDMSTFSLDLTGNNASPTIGGILKVANNSTGNQANALFVTASGNGASAVYGQGSGNARGILGISNTNAAVHGESDAGYGIYGFTYGEVPSGMFAKNTNVTDTVLPILEIFRNTSGSAQAGMGASMLFTANAPSGKKTTAELISRFTDITSGVEHSAFDIHTYTAGVSTRKFILKSDGRLTLPLYGTGILTGTPTYNLATDASGNIIEVAAGGSSNTADNGLTLNGSILELGGTLNRNTSVQALSNYFTWSSNLSGSAFTVTNSHNTGQAIYASSSANGRAIHGASDGGVAIQGNSNFSFGLNGISLHSSGVSGTSTNGKGAQFLNNNETAGTVQDVVGIYRSVTSAGTNGLGSALVFGIKSSTGSPYTTNSNKIISRWTTADHATRTAEMVFQGTLLGVEADKFIIKGNGVINIPTPTLEYADNAAALTAGLVVGDIYRTGDFMKIVH